MPFGRRPVRRHEGRSDMGAPISLSELLAGIASVTAQADRPVQALQIDSRQVTAGDVFVAMPGVSADGRGFVTDAVARGAAAVLIEDNGALPDSGVATIAVSKLR